MAFAIPIITALSGLAGIASTVMGLTKKDKAPSPQPLPPTPNPADAAAQAAADAAKKRKLISNTDLTSGSALVPNVNVAQKSLLGQ